LDYGRALKQEGVREQFQEAFEHQPESYQLNGRIGRLDGICFVGFNLG